MFLFVNCSNLGSGSSSSFWSSSFRVAIVQEEWGKPFSPLHSIYLSWSNCLMNNQVLWERMRITHSYVKTKKNLSASSTIAKKITHLSQIVPQKFYIRSRSKSCCFFLSFFSFFIFINQPWYWCKQNNYITIYLPTTIMNPWSTWSIKPTTPVHCFPCKSTHVYSAFAQLVCKNKWPNWIGIKLRTTSSLHPSSTVLAYDTISLTELFPADR